MSFSHRARVGAGVLGAVALLAGGASWATAGSARPHSRTQAVRAHLSSARPRNVIFFLGDGMGTQEITAARYYQYGAAGRMNVDRLPFTGFQTTWSVKPGDHAPYLPDYDPDSASTGTMWATGEKTIDERISQSPSTALDVPGDDLPTVLEHAQQAGKLTGDVTTAELSDATPAVLASHISNRGCQGPADTRATCPSETKAAGGPGSIAEQEVDHGVDVLLGGGRARFEQPLRPGGARTVIASARRQGYRYVSDATGLGAVHSIARKPVLGLFAPVNMTTEWNGPVATRADGTPAQRCETGHRPASEPSLSAMTRKSIDLLDAGASRRGFFLQVEGASIDKQDHAANACAQIGETVAFDDAIGVALRYQQTHRDTLIVVTADHAHTSQIVAEDTTDAGDPTGYSNNLTTHDGQVMRVTYGTAGGTTPPAAPPSQQHTGSVVPIWAGGPRGAAVLGTTDHTDLFAVLQGRQP